MLSETIIRPHIKTAKVFLSVLAAQPFLAVTREMLRIPGAAITRALTTSGILEQLLRLFPLSQIRIEMMVRALGGIQPQGVAVAGIPGELLHLLVPTFFLEPKLVACGAIGSAVIPRGGTVIGHVFSGTIVDSLLLAIGTVFVNSSLGNRPIAELLKHGKLRNILLLAFGIIIQIQAAWAILSAFRRPKVVEDLGGNFLVGTYYPVGSQQFVWTLNEFLPIAIPLLIIAAVVFSALILGKVFNRVLLVFRRETGSQAARSMSIQNNVILPLAQVVVILFAQWNPPYFGMAKSSMLGLLEPSALCARAARDYFGAANTPTRAKSTPTLVVTRSVQVTLTPTPTAKPTQVRFPQVRLAREGDRFKLLIDSKPTQVLGINYNIDYTHLPVSRQVARHSQDFQLLATHGFKFVTGWGIFNEATLETAGKYGVKVVMPIDLDPKNVYENPSFRSEAINKLVATVARFQDSPTVIMWNPGGDEFLANVEDDLTNRGVNEDQQKIVLQDMADLLVEMARQAYRSDPHNRPSVIKQVQDWHVENLERSLGKARELGDDPSTYVIYGADVYGWPDYIAPILQRVESATQRLGLAWLVTEFGPVGTGQANRTEGYVEAFRLIKKTSSIGALVYVFAPDLPDPVLAAPLSFVSIHDDPDDDSKRSLIPVDSTLQDLGDEFLRAQQE